MAPQIGCLAKGVEAAVADREDPQIAAELDEATAEIERAGLEIKERIVAQLLAGIATAQQELAKSLMLGFLVSTK